MLCGPVTGVLRRGINLADRLPGLLIASRTGEPVIRHSPTVIDDSSHGTGYALAFGTGIVSGGANVISERVSIDYDGITVQRRYRCG